MKDNTLVTLAPLIAMINELPFGSSDLRMRNEWQGRKGIDIHGRGIIFLFFGSQILYKFCYY